MKSALALINNIRKKDRPKRNGFIFSLSLIVWFSMNRKRFLSFYTYEYMYNNYKYYKTHPFLNSPRSDN